MKMIRKIIIIGLMILCTSSIYGQRKSNDSLFALRELIQLRKIYSHLPLELNIHVKNSAAPFTTGSDSLNAEMDVYSDSHNFYLKTEGLEEIVNDSLIIMVNNPAKSILLYPNKQQLIMNMEKSVAAIIPDSSIETLAKRYSSFVSLTGHDQKKIELKSREVVYGTTVPRESINIVYRVSSYQPLEFARTKAVLLPIDSATYNKLEMDTGYNGKLVSTSASNNNLFFLVKELTTSYRFDKIHYDIPVPPVKEKDRVVKEATGEYVPAKGFEEYVLSKQF